VSARQQGPRWCGNAVPRSQWPDLTRDVVDQFAAYLVWSATDPATRGEPPAEVDRALYDRHGTRYDRPPTGDTPTAQSSE
jgi:hypothetical protein